MAIFNIFVFPFFLNKQRLLYPSLPTSLQKRGGDPSIPFVSLILKSQKDLQVFLVLYLHAKAKAHPISFEGIIYSVQSQGLL